MLKTLKNNANIWSEAQRTNVRWAGLAIVCLAAALLLWACGPQPNRELAEDMETPTGEVEALRERVDELEKKIGELRAVLESLVVFSLREEVEATVTKSGAVSGATPSAAGQRQGETPTELYGSANLVEMKRIAMCAELSWNEDQLSGKELRMMLAFLGCTQGEDDEREGEGP